MSVCWFYVQGRCRFGDRCRYLHPREGYPHSDRCNLQQDNYRSSHQSRSPQQPLVRASSFDFNAALEQTRKQEERQKPRGYRDPSYGGSYGSAEDRHVDRDWYQGNQNRYQSNQDSYQDRYQGNQDRYHGSRDRYQGSQERYQGNRNRYQEDQDQHLGSQSKHRWVKDGHQSERSDNRSNGKAAVTFDFNKALDEATKLDEDRDASESLGDASLGVVRDMKTWRASGQWPFSSYGPYANSLSYPGFADASMEEVRWECYQAKEAGTMSAYIQQLNQIGQNVQQNIDHLLAMTPTAKEILANLPLGQNAKAPFAPAGSGCLAVSSSGSTATAKSSLPQVPIMPAARPQAASERAASIYSLVQDLTEEERQQFLAENFSPGKMPQRPPPREYCALP
uniref:Nucleoporin NUP42 n=1 Tax=Ixodes ricinus TaxID=34613 RepID=A0A131Y8M2_IXORI